MVGFDANDVLVFDIETYVPGHKPDSSKDRLRIFGCYSYKTNKQYLLTDKEEIQKIISAHKFLVGYNIREYDNPVLKREGLDLEFKIIIDMYDIIKQRAGNIMIKKGMLKDIMMMYKLDYVTRLLDLVGDDEAKLEIDYDMFKKPSWSPEETKLIAEYTKRDIEITRKLYEWLENYFHGFKDFLRPEDIRKKVYLTSSIAKFAYKAICKSMKWEEMYGQWGTVSEEDSISGGYVAFPSGERFEGDIYALDFNSLYPHIMIQCNLYGRKREGVVDDRPTWNGGELWDVEGNYYSDEMSGVGKLLRKWYFTRLYFKRNVMIKSTKEIVKMKDIIANYDKYKDDEYYYVDISTDNLDLLHKPIDEKIIEEYKQLVEQGVDGREYSIKIIINTIYGILNTPYYMRVFDIMAGGDCTRIGRQWTKYARKKFHAAGYELCYTDTDSVYVKDPFDNKDKLMAVVNSIVKDIRDSTPFPQMTFDMGVDAEIKFMYFFKGKHKENENTDMDEFDPENKKLGLMKKNYIYITKENKLSLLNLGLKKKSNSPLSKKIFWEYMVPKMKEGESKFSRAAIENLMIEHMSKDLQLVGMRKEVGPFSQYERTSPTGFQAKISKRYGPGVHFLIPNTMGIGIGDKTKYCSEKEFKDRGYNYGHVDLSGVWSELNYFLKRVEERDIFSFSE